MKKHYIYDEIENKQIYNGGNDPIVIVALDNYEILYLNAAAKGLQKDKSFRPGIKCHEYFHSSVDICKNCMINNKNIEEREIYVEDINKYYLAQIERIKWKGRDAVIQHLNDVTLEKEYEKAKKDLSVAIKHSGINYIEWDITNDIAHLELVPTDFLCDNKLIKNFIGTLKESKYLLKEDIDKYEKSLYSLINGDINDLVIEARRITFDNKYEWRRYYITVNEWNHNGKPKKAIISSIAINELKKLESSFTVLLKQNKITSWTYYPKTGEISDVKNPVFGIINENIKNIEELYQGHKRIHPDDVETINKLYSDVNNGAQDVNCIARLKQGEVYKWAKISYTSIYDRDGSVLYAIGSSYDMTEDMELKLQYDETIKLFKEASDSNDLAIMIDIKDEQVVSFNGKSRVTNLENISYDEYLESLRTNALREEDVKWFDTLKKDNLFELYNKGERVIEKEIVFKSEIGVKWYRDTFKLIKNPDNNHLMLLITTIDISNEKNLEKIIQSVANVEFEMLITVNLIDDSFIMYSKGGHNYSGNNFFEKAKENIKEINYEKTNMFPEKLSDKNEIIKILEGKERYVDYVNVKSNGLNYHKKVNINYVDESKNAVCIYVTDVSDIYNNEQKKNEELKKAKEEAEKANAVKTDFLGKMSHDMRTPLNAIMSLSDFGLEEAKDLNVKDYFGKIKSSSELLLGILNDLLDLAGIEKDNIELNLRPVKVYEHAESILELVKPKADAKGIEIEFDYNPIALNEYEIFDPIRTAQIFTNIIVNAIKYTPTSGKIIWRVEDELLDNGKIHHCHEIIDNGMGMDKAFLEELFKPFTRENRGLGQIESGTGLGMSIVKNILEVMGGTIDCKSKKNEGTVFKVEFDCVISTEEDYENYINRNNKTYKSNLTNKRVLICEDVKINAQIVKKILNKVEMDVDIAENGLEGVKKAELNDYDIILMDIRMPIMDGLTAANKIREFDKKTPIIALSANAYKEDVEKSYESGMNAHLAKPIKKQELIRTIAKLM
ncbi:MAG TPA: response regulator [Anaerovoracaceae bacterium]|nr:response regulator [Anaerovoracaceae bacterium]